MSLNETDLAIIGVACRLPGHSNDLPSFWENLNKGRDCVVSTPADRWNKEFYTNAQKEVPGKITTDRCGFVDHVFDFDYETFGISKREAENMDPQHKVLLECTMQAFEDARVDWLGSNTGVYVGIGQAEQLELTTSDLESINAYSVTGSALSIAANRISYCFDLRGPSVAIDTACSSAMSAMHMAVQAVRRGECSQAVVAGVNLLMSPSVMIQFAKLGVMSPDGRCKSFTDIANGYVRSEGCGAVIIKPLTQALRDNNHIYAVMKGTALNQDGHLSPSLTLPSGEAQAIAFQAACNDAKISPADVFFAEAHATGTKVGDPVEANAIGRVFGAGRKVGAPKANSLVEGETQDVLRLGAVKTHVGHLECASYMAGLIKVLLMIEHETLVPNLYSGPEYNLNPAIEFDKYNMRAQSKHEAFNPHGKLFMISSFGFGGANGCSILQGFKPKLHVPRALLPPSAAGGESEQQTEAAAAAKEASDVPQGPYLFLASAATPAALDARVKELQSSPELAALHPYDVSYTLSTRSLHRNVSVGVGADLKSAVFAPGKKLADDKQSLIWVFAGQGPQHPEMGRTLYERYPAFRKSIEEMDAVYKAVSGESLVHDVGLFGAKRGDPNAVYTLQYTLPSLVFLQTALCDLWTSFGVKPAAVFGHSFGEMAAAYAAGVCDKKQLVATAYHRARLLAKIDGLGVMMAVGAGHELIQPWLDEEEQVWVAAYNGPNSITVGGLPASVQKIAKRCAAAGIFHRVLKITNAYHTPLMSPCHDEAIATFRETLHGTRAPQIPYFSTVHKVWKNDEFDEHYTWAGIVGPVYFTDAVKAAQERYGEQCVFMEMSAHPVLSSYLTECGAKNTCLTLNRTQNEVETTLKLFAYLKIQGFDVDLKRQLGPVRHVPFIAPYKFQYQFCHREDPDHRIMREVPVWRPLAGREFPHTTLCFQQKVSLKSHAWTADHVVQGPVVFPAAGYIEMCMEVLSSASVGDITIGRAMIVPNDANVYRTMRTIADEEKKSVKLYSKVDQWDTNPWTQHVAAAKTALEPLSALPAWCNGLRDRCKSHMNQKAVYERFKSVGLQYGPLFQGVTSLYTGDNEAFGIMNVKAIHEHSTQFYVHPALLDSTFHVLLGTIRYMYLPYVPTWIRRIQWFVKPEDMGEIVHVYARANTADNSLEGDIVVTTEAGVIVGVVEGMQCTALGQTANQRPMQPTYTVTWQQLALPQEVSSSAASTSLQAFATVPATAAAAAESLDNAFVAGLASFFEAIKASPKPVNFATLPAPKQQLVQFLQSVLASRTPSADALAALATGVAGFELEVQLVQRLLKGMQDLVLDPYGFSKVFGDNLVADLFTSSASFKPAVQAVVDQVVALVSQHPSRVFNILDLSNSSIAVASAILPLLNTKELKGRVRYVFGDSNNKTVSDARAKFSEINFVDFKSLSLEQELTAQGVLGHSFDVVIANASLHTATSAPVAAQRVQSVLVPSGVVFVVEPASAPLYMQTFLSLFKGWNVVAKQAWLDAFSQAGFRNVTVLSTAAAEAASNVVFSAQSSSLALNASAPAVPATTVVFDMNDASNTMDKLLAFSQQHYESKEALDVWVLTSASQNIASAYTASSAEPVHAPFIGFTRVFANECTQHRVRMIDFGAESDAAVRQQWVNTLSSLAGASLEREYAVRDGKVLVPRFIPYATREESTATIATASSNAPYRLEVDAVGQISSLKYHQVLTANGTMLDYKPDDVVIDVKAAALNFKDLMLALGMLNNPMGLDKQALRFFPPTAMGLECSGVIIAVGSEVTRFKVGDEVFGICEHSIASQVVTNQNFVAKKPAHMSHVDAASLPIVFCTSYAGLMDKARIQKGETVLVHSAAGGIGQSSIQLCKYVGADVIATVGNVKKRAYLTERYGVTKFADSHSNAAWRDDVKALTNGEGVDVCINSLKGEAIPFGLASLKTGGRFVEIGKVDILADNNMKMGVFLRDLSFLSVQLDILMTANSARVSKYMTAISELADGGHITSLVDKVFPARDIEPAFRYLMAGQHMGKVMIDFAAEHRPSLVYPSSKVFSSATTYMMSGGAGAVGLRMVQWMAEQGARNFILLSRRGEAALRASELAELRSLERFGVKVLVAKADVGRQADVKAAYDLARSQGHPAKVGLMHLAMVLEDDILPKQTPARFAPVLACKIDGIRNMVTAFPKELVDFVVMFSSVSSVLGNPAQSNYAAGNCFLDSYAFYLQAQGYKAKTVNLGSIEDVGVLAEDYKLRMVLNMKGFAGGLTSHGVCLIVDEMLRDTRYTQYVHGSVDWPTVIESYPIMVTRFTHLIDYTALNSSSGGAGDNVVTLAGLAGAVSALLEVPADKLDTKEPITRQGLDSLLAVELSSTLKKKFGVTVSQMELLGGLSVEDIFKVAQAQ